MFAAVVSQACANLLQNVDLVQLLSGFLSPWGIATGATSFALSIVGLVSAGLIVLFFGIYFAADPDTYVQLVARLAPEERRPAALQTMYELENTVQLPCNISSAKPNFFANRYMVS